MKRFIRYLYEYDQGKRMRNVGFVKVEQMEDECMVHIHGKGLQLTGENRLSLYLFYEEHGECIRILQGETDNVNPSVNVQLRYTKEDVGMPENFGRIRGIMLESARGRRFIVLWEEASVNFGRIKDWEEAEKQTVREEQPIREEAPVREEQPVREESPEEVMTLEQTPENRSEENDGDEDEADKEEIPLIRSERIAFDEPVSDRREYRIPEEMPREQRQGFRYARKIQRTEISRLARCEWRLANNRFLLHGYYNYHHLILMEKGEELQLGVPGIYHEREAAAAADFGFPEFVPADQLEVSLEQEERNEEERFGYWCRPVRKAQPWK